MKRVLLGNLFKSWEKLEVRGDISRFSQKLIFNSFSNFGKTVL